MHLLRRATAPLLGLLGVVTFVAAINFALSSHELSGLLVALLTIVLAVDAAAFGVLAWASSTPGPTWRPAALILIVINLMATVLDQVGALDIVVIVLMIVTAVAVLATSRSRVHVSDDPY